MKRAGIGLIVALGIGVTAAPLPAQLGRIKQVKQAIDDAKKDTAKTAKPEQPATQNGQSGQADFKTAKIEFVPGERTIFYDDFSDMAEDEPPPHWKVRGGKVELWAKGGVRELRQSGEGELTMTTPAIVVPKNFTFQLQWTGNGEMLWYFYDKDGNEMLMARVRGEEDGKTASVTVHAAEELGSGSIETDTSEPVRFDLWAQQGRVRAYLNGQRLVDANQVEFAAIDHITAYPSRYRPNGIRSVRVAESAPDFSTVIGSTGKYVTHGITFDTGSDKVKPESAPVLRMVAAALTKNPALKLEIGGHTDGVGNAAQNLDLSRRRAEAVKAVLVSQLGADASRLTTAGFGSAKPIAPNDTPQGRADNRRVEFVKQ